MKTYGLTKDWRTKLYIRVFAISVIIYVLLDHFLLSKIVVLDKFVFLVRALVSLISFSGINAIFLFIINLIYTKKSKLNGKYDIQLVSSHKETVVNGQLQIKINLYQAKIIFKGKTSHSESCTVFIDNEDTDRLIITYTYCNDGNVCGGNKLSRHKGTSLLVFENGTFSEGEYYTDGHRKTHGIIKGKKINE
jgi:hypothetical protein